MTASIKISIQQLNPQLVQELQEKYPDGEIEVRVHSEAATKRLSEDTFWKIIARLDWSKEEAEDAAVIAPAVEHLAAMPLSAIYGFQDMLSEKLYMLDARRFAEQIGEDAYQEEAFFSVDHFLYARCCVIANGKEAYEKVLQNPTLMPKDLTFEALLSVASKAYQLKTSSRLEYLPTFNYETFSNKAGWQ